MSKRRIDCPHCGYRHSSQAAVDRCGKDTAYSNKLRQEQEAATIEKRRKIDVVVSALGRYTIVGNPESRQDLCDALEDLLP